MADNVSSLFSTFIKSVELEVNTLKCLTNLRSIDPNSENINILHTLNDAVTQMEEDFGHFDASLDQELATLDKMQELMILCQKQRSQIEAIQKAVKSDSRFLCADTIQESNKARAADSSMPPPPPLPHANPSKSVEIQAEEFEAVSKTTRGRLQLSAVSRYYTVLQDLTSRKQKVKCY
jgi:hypothetical protein